MQRVRTTVASHTCGSQGFLISYPEATDHVRWIFKKSRKRERLKFAMDPASISPCSFSNSCLQPDIRFRFQCKTLRPYESQQPAAGDPSTK